MFLGTFTREDFEQSLADALQGEVLSCVGHNDELHDAFCAIADADEPSEELIQLARSAFERAKLSDPERFAE